MGQKASGVRFLRMELGMKMPQTSTLKFHIPLVLSVIQFWAIFTTQAQNISTRIKIDPSGHPELDMDASAAPGAVLDVFKTTQLGDGAKWTLAKQELAPDLTGQAQWTDTTQDRMGFYAVGRADEDRDANGIPDLRHKLLHQFDLPAESRAKWARTGLPFSPPDYTNTISVVDYGADGSDTLDDTAAFKLALKRVVAPGVVEIPPGRYYISYRLYIPDSVILRGAGSEETELFFSGSGTEERCLGICKWDSDQTHAPEALTADAAKGDTWLSLSDASDFSIGDIAEIEQDNQPDWPLTDDWQQNLVGQIVRIIDVDQANQLLLIDRPLRIDFTTALQARIRVLNTIQNSGIENLRISREDDTDGYTIELKYAVRCWVRNVEGAYTSKAHVWMERGFENSVSANYFHDSWDYGGDGHGYGVACGRHTSDCRVENNVFNHLRHAMIVGSGANGNVFGYNFSTNRAICPDYGTKQPDISVHGNYVFMNLFEGNVLEDADLPDWFHPAGPFNTLFRNRVVNYGDAVEVSSDGANVVGNELPRGHIFIEDGIKNVLCHANLIQGEMQWDSTQTRDLPDSLYRATRPDFIEQAGTAWPPIGEGLNHTIPAEKRFSEGQPVPPAS